MKIIDNYFILKERMENKQDHKSLLGQAFSFSMV